MNKSLEELRKEIDTLDESIIEILGKRMEIVKKIGEVKKELGQEILDENRWQTLLQNIKKQAGNLHLDTSFIEDLYTIIHEQAQKIERKE